ncbi:MAG: peptide-N-glycosidase [Cyclobacteriaceae bacterium]|nr:peptide-N-glycosidase [Cyclobacteriaceae bacterium]
MKLYLASIFLLLAHILPAQNLKKDDFFVEINYHRYNNGKRVPNSEITLIYGDQIVFLSKPDEKIRSFMDYRKNENVTIIDYEGQLYKTITPFDSLPKPTFSNKKETILGYECTHASFFSFSNKIDVWYTEKSGVLGSPYSRYIPNNNSLALKVVINGNRTLIADSFDKIKGQPLPDYPVDKAKEISNAELEELKIKSRYIKLTVFDEETINFDPSITPAKINDADKDQIYHFSKGTLIMKKITLPDIVREGARIFAKLTSWSNEDAYDRTGSVFIISPSGKKISMLNAFQEGVDKLPVYTGNKGRKYQGITCDANYDTPVEVMRFFTSFGVRHFNELRVINNYPWKEAVTYKQEITPLIPNNKEDIWIGVFIGNYDKGGHKVSLELNFYPSFEKKEQTDKWIQPVFSTVNILEMSGQNYGRLFKNNTLSISFDYPENIEHAQLLYTSTGHGGWGNGDEFNPKLNQIFIDGQQIYNVVPWRTDCATYRLSNPASGNFGNGISSSDLSRSNWCPATLTPPYFIPLNNLKKGKHVMEVVIDQGDDEGNSFNHWNISGIIVGEIKSVEN